MMRGKTVLITGGAGFIGSNFLNTVVPRYPDEHFINLDVLTYAGNLANISVADAPNYTFVQADIRDMLALRDIFEKYKPTHIIHFAAESHVDNSITGPQAFIETNINGTFNLLECARENKISRFHHISTDEVYGALGPSDKSWTEDSPLLPNSPYSASKASAEMLVRAYHRTYGLDTVITRASNNYGPRQHREKLLPLFITNLHQGKKVPVYGNGKNMRDWLWVGDHVEGIDLAFRKGKSGEAYNLGGGMEITNINLTKELLSLMGLDETRISYVEDRKGHDFRYAIDSTKAERELGWTPKKSFTEGLRETIHYYAAP